MIFFFCHPQDIMVGLVAVFTSNEGMSALNCVRLHVRKLVGFLEPCVCLLCAAYDNVRSDEP